MTASNIAGESSFSPVIYQYASAVASSLSTPSVLIGSRTDSSLVVSWSVPGSSTTTVLGYKLYINYANSNDIPSILVYNGEAIPSVLQ